MIRKKVKEILLCLLMLRRLWCCREGKTSLEGTGARIENMLARRASKYGLGMDPDVFR